MKAYGLPRICCWKYNDVADMHEFGRKSSLSGVKRGVVKNKANKRATRRIFKRRARIEGNAACQEI